MNLVFHKLLLFLSLWLLTLSSCKILSAGIFHITQVPPKNFCICLYQELLEVRAQDHVHLILPRVFQHLALKSNVHFLHVSVNTLFLSQESRFRYSIFLVTFQDPMQGCLSTPLHMELQLLALIIPSYFYFLLLCRYGTQNKVDTARIRGSFKKFLLFGEASGIFFSFISCEINFLLQRHCIS